MTIQITLDTSVFIEEDVADPLKQASIRCRDLCEQLHRTGTIEVAISTRFEADKASDRDLDRVARHFARLEPYERVAAGFRLDVSHLGVDVLHGDAEDGDIIGELEQLFLAGITSPRRREHSMFDADHIWAHWAAKRDYFVTSDTQATGRLRGELFERFGIKVLAPVEFVAAHEAAEAAAHNYAIVLVAELDRRHRASAK